MYLFVLYRSFLHLSICFLSQNGHIFGASSQAPDNQIFGLRRGRQATGICVLQTPGRRLVELYSKKTTCAG